MRCPCCRKALPLSTFFTRWRRTSLLRCRHCKGLARYDGHRPWYGPMLFVAACASGIAAPASSWMRLGAMVFAFWLVDGFSRRFVPARPDSEGGEGGRR